VSSDAALAIRFQRGLDALASSIRAFPTAGMFPDGSPARILRRARVACNDRGACAVTLIVPEDARPVK
jgi:hypothetical protein